MSYQNKARQIRKSSRSAFAGEPVVDQDWDQEAFFAGFEDLLAEEDRALARASRTSIQTGT